MKLINSQKIDLKNKLEKIIDGIGFPSSKKQKEQLDDIAHILSELYLVDIYKDLDLDDIYVDKAIVLIEEYLNE